MEPILLKKWSEEPNFKNIVLDYNNERIDSNEDYTTNKLRDLRMAGLVHKITRKYAQENIKPGMKVLDCCKLIENKVDEMFKILKPYDNIKKGLGFPVGFSINNCAAHDSATINDKRVIKEDDVIKVDFGTHVNGNIIDSAFTLAFNEKYNSLLSATMEATNKAISMAGIDVPIDDISENIQEVIESYEIELDGKTYPIYAITNLGGHTIEPYKIHSGKLLLCGLHSKTNSRMEEGEVWAIETFASTGGRNVVNSSDEITHFSLENTSPNLNNFRLQAPKNVFKFIKNTKKTLPFSDRYVVDNFKGKGSLFGLRKLAKDGIVKCHPPLITKKGSFTSQLEHTLIIKEYGKEILSHGEDY